MLVVLLWTCDHSWHPYHVIRSSQQYQRTTAGKSKGKKVRQRWWR